MDKQLKVLCLFDDDLNIDASFQFSHFLKTIKKPSLLFGCPLVDVRNKEGKDFDYSIIEDYHIVFLFGKAINIECNRDNPIKNSLFLKFMEKGGGIFGAGDHANLGSDMCGDIPRLKHMREWSSNPDRDQFTRLSTVRYNDYLPYNTSESDDIPQRLHLYYDTNNLPHQLLQIPLGIPDSSKVIQFFPDHPHEGECKAPDSGDEVYKKIVKVSEETTRLEFPSGIEIQPVAKAMASGSEVLNSDPLSPTVLIPREFLAISTFDGHTLKKPEGRIVADASWHHFLDLNLKGFKKNNLEEISKYYTNIMEWLAPPEFQLLWKPMAIKKAMRLYPFAELSGDISQVSGGLAVLKLGQLMKETLRTFLNESQIHELSVYLAAKHSRLTTLLLERARESSTKQYYFSAVELIQDSILGHATLNEARLYALEKAYARMGVIKEVLRNNQNYSGSVERAIDTLQKCEDDHNTMQKFLKLVSLYKNDNISFRNQENKAGYTDDIIATISELTRNSISEMGTLVSEINSLWDDSVVTELEILNEFDTEYLQPVLNIN